MGGNDQGVQGQAAELLKLVMDLTLLEARDRDQCLDAFYDRGVLDELSSALRSDAKHAMDQCALFGPAGGARCPGCRAGVSLLRGGASSVGGSGCPCGDCVAKPGDYRRHASLAAAHLQRQQWVHKE